MDDIKLTILIPSYGRPEVLGLTLKNLLANTISYSMEIDIDIGIMEHDGSEILVEELIEEGQDIHIDYRVYGENIGKADCLNDLYSYHRDSDYILALDNDIVFRQPWVHVINAAMRSQDLYGPFDICGFAGKNFFFNLPEKEELSPFIFPVGQQVYKLYYPIAIGGAAHLFNRDGFLPENPWRANGDGVYCGVDALHCELTIHKRVIEYDAYWVEHDPLGPKLYPKYAEVKQEMIDDGIRVFQKGWDK